MQVEAVGSEVMLEAHFKVKLAGLEPVTFRNLSLAGGRLKPGFAAEDRRFICAGCGGYANNNCPNRE
jgi:hypothetical protein